MCRVRSGRTHVPRAHSVNAGRRSGWPSASRRRRAPPPARAWPRTDLGFRGSASSRSCRAGRGARPGRACECSLKWWRDRLTSEAGARDSVSVSFGSTSNILRTRQLFGPRSDDPNRETHRSRMRHHPGGEDERRDPGVFIPTLERIARGSHHFFELYVVLPQRCCRLFGIIQRRSKGGARWTLARSWHC